MSLTSSLNNAVSGLQANQTLMRVASSNIANANTEGYSKKTGELSAVILGGIGAGVNVDDIRRTVDNFLIKEANVQSSTVAKADAMTEFYSRLQDLFGTPEANSSIAGQLNELRTAFEELAVDPNLSVTQFTTVTAAKELTDSLNNLAVTLQEMRQEVDRQINDAVDIVNEQLVRLDKLNADIVRNKVIGSPTGDLEDQRDMALAAIAEQIDIKWFTKSNGAVYVMTGSDYTILDSDPYPINFSSPPGVSKQTVYPGGFSAIEIEGSIADVTPFIKSGRVAALIELRDEVLVGLQEQIDQLTSMTADEVNRAYNSTMPVPGLKRFTGLNEFDSSVLLDPANPQSIPLTPYNDGTVTEYGSIQFAITDDNGDVVGEALRVNLDEFKAEMEAYVTSVTALPFTYDLTVGDIINMLNGAYAATPPATVPVPPAPAGWPGAAPWPPTPPLTMTSTGSDIAGLTNLSGASVAGGLASGTFADIQNGALVISLPTSSPYGLAIDDTNTSFSVAGDTRPQRFNYLMGLNNLFVIDPDAVSSSYDIEVREDIVQDPAKLGRGYLTSVLRDPTDTTTEEWYVATGDGRGATDVANVFQSSFLFDEAGTLPQASQRITEYAAAIIQFNASNAAVAESNYEFQKNLQTELETRKAQVSGVNIDEELARLVGIQSAYAASARVVTTVNGMYDDLLNM